MLSLIPALILIAFHGPSGVERLAHEGRLPDALRALERVLAPAESDASDGQSANRLREAKSTLGSWSSLLWGAEFTQVLSQFLQFEFESDSPHPAPTIAEPPSTDESETEPKDMRASRHAGFAECHPTRAGPRA
ncbi:MAG TPA: hypothetical protein PLX06_13005 [Fimbriimonadaceae bacterium]|nr:hypothetical protein [Fimbriimonadaceae bacterium]